MCISICSRKTARCRRDAGRITSRRASKCSRRGRGVQQLLDSKVVRNMQHFIRMRCHAATRQDDIARCKFHTATQRSPLNNTLLQEEFDKEMLFSFGSNDVSEIYSFPNVVWFAKQFNLVEGWGSDLSTMDDDVEQLGGRM